MAVAPDLDVPYGVAEPPMSLLGDADFAQEGKRCVNPLDQSVD